MIWGSTTRSPTAESVGEGEIEIGDVGIREAAGKCVKAW